MHRARFYVVREFSLLDRQGAMLGHGPDCIFFGFDMCIFSSLAVIITNVDAERILIESDLD